MIARCLLVLALWALLLLPNASAAEAEQEPDLTEQRIEANALIQQKQYAKAIELLTGIIKRLPVNDDEVPELLHDLRRACDGGWAGGQFVQTVNELFERLDKAELDEQERTGLRRVFLWDIAKYHYDHRQTLDAVKRYEELLAIVPADQKPAIEKTLAGLYEEAGFHAKALGLLEKKLRAAPDDASLRRRVASLHIKLGDVDKGIAVLGAGDNTHRVRSLAEQLYRARYLAEAEALALKIADKDGRARLLLADIYTEQKKFPEAEALLRRSLAEVNLHEANDYSAFSTAEKLAEVHRHEGTLQQALAEVKKRLMEPDAGQVERRRSFILLSQLHKLSEEPQEALAALLEYRELIGKKDRANYRIARLGRAALKHLVSQYRASDAEALLRDLEERGVEGTWTECAWYALHVLRNDAQDAKKVLDALEQKAGDDEARVYSLIHEFESWEMEHICERLCRRVLELKPDRSVYDANAHIRLGQWLYQKRQFAEAIEHFDEVNASLTGRSMGLMNEDHFRRLEVYARYHAADNDVAVLVKLLRDARPARQMAAVRLLGAVGRPEHVGELEALVPAAPPKLRSAIEEAVAAIRGRYAVAPGTEKPVTEDELPDLMAQRGRVLWIEKDPFQEPLRWVSVEGKFILSVDLKTGQVHDHRRAAEVLGRRDLSASHVAFSADTVWVGTDHGLFAYDRKGRRWSGYAISRKHLDVPVTGLQVQEDAVLVTVKVGGGEHTWRFVPETGEWKKM